jgi:hypothetical protein
LLRSAVEKLQAANASPSFGRDQTRSAFRWYAVDRGLGLRRATTYHITTDRNHTRKRALKAPLRTSVFTAWSLHKEHTQHAPVWQVSLLRTGSGDPGVLAMTNCPLSARKPRAPRPCKQTTTAPVIARRPLGRRSNPERVVNPMSLRGALDCFPFGYESGSVLSVARSLLKVQPRSAKTASKTVD